MDRCDLQSPHGDTGYCTREKGHTGPCAWQPGERPGVSVFDALRIQKLIVLFEIEPNSDRFQQLMLSPESSARVNRAIQDEVVLVPIPGRPDKEGRIFVTNPEYSLVLRDIPQYYDLERIRELLKSGPDYTRP